MSGGIAYVYDPDETLLAKTNLDTVELEPVEGADADELKALIERHRELTGSEQATRLLTNWNGERTNFRKVMPVDYRRALAELAGESAKAGMAAASAARPSPRSSPPDPTPVAPERPHGFPRPARSLTRPRTPFSSRSLMGNPTGFKTITRAVPADRDPLLRILDWNEFHQHMSEERPASSRAPAAWTAASRSATPATS